MPLDKFLGLLGLAMRAGKLSCGAYGAARSAREGQARLMVAAEDIGADNLRRIRAVCRQYGVPLAFCSTTAELSRGLGKKNIPVVAVCDGNFAAAAEKYDLKYDLNGKDGSANE